MTFQAHVIYYILYMYIDCKIGSEQDANMNATLRIHHHRMYKWFMSFFPFYDGDLTSGLPSKRSQNQIVSDSFLTIIMNVQYQTNTVSQSENRN